MLSQAVSQCQRAQLEAISCSSFIREATTTRLCRVLQALPFRSQTLANITANLLCGPTTNPIPQEPLIVDVLPSDGMRVYGRTFPFLLQVSFAPQVPPLVQQAYWDTCQVHASINSIHQFTTPLRHYYSHPHDADGQEELIRMAPLVQV